VAAAESDMVGLTSNRIDFAAEALFAAVAVVGSDKAELNESRTDFAAGVVQNAGFGQTCKSFCRRCCCCCCCCCFYCCLLLAYRRT
jgi:hypothetical protein